MATQRNVLIGSSVPFKPSENDIANIVLENTGVLVQFKDGSIWLLTSILERGWARYA